MIEYGNLIYEDNSFNRVIDTVPHAKELIFHENTIIISDKTQKHIFDVINVEKVIFNKKLYYIPKNFLKHSAIKEIDLSKTNISSIHQEAFFDCENLEKIILPSSLSKIGSNAFTYCEKLKEIDLSNTKIEVIRNETFVHCINLSKIFFPDTLKRIDNFVFYNCKNLKEITIPNNFKDFYLNLFMENGIKKVYYNNLDEYTKKIFETLCKENDVKLVANDLDALLSENKSFKEINNILKQQER